MDNIFIKDFPEIKSFNCIMEAIELLKKVDLSDEFNNTMMATIINNLHGIALHHKNHTSIKTKKNNKYIKATKSLDVYFYGDNGKIITEEEIDEQCYVFAPLRELAFYYDQEDLIPIAKRLFNEFYEKFNRYPSGISLEELINHYQGNKNGKRC